jgi:hypothetical protein
VVRWKIEEEEAVQEEVQEVQAVLPVREMREMQQEVPEEEDVPVFHGSESTHPAAPET